MDVVEWAGAIAVALVLALIVIVAVVSAVREFKKNPLKKQFDTKPEDK